MKTYGQFCSIARALDTLGQRWALLLVREVLCGSHRFGELQRGLPQISRTMLSARLRELCDAGVLARTTGAHGPEYRLTPAGEELGPIVMQLGTWGQRWLSRHDADDDLDADFLLWDIHRRVRLDALPKAPVVVRFELVDRPVTKDRRYLLLRRSEVSLCGANPGFPAELTVRSPVRTVVGWWRGELTFPQARRADLELTGPAALVRAFPTWFERYLFAEVASAA